jgi:excisionase family DNA binding protein
MELRCAGIVVNAPATVVAIDSLALFPSLAYKVDELYKMSDLAELERGSYERSTVRGGRACGMAAHAPGSSRAVEFLRDHPDRAERVVAAALEDAAFDETGSSGAPDDASRAVPEALRRFIIVPDNDETGLLSVSEASERLAVSRPTIYAWIEQNRLVAWRVTRRGHLIPAKQIVGPGELVPGIDRVLAAIPQPRAAWRFLVEESPFLPGEHGCVARLNKQLS